MVEAGRIRGAWKSAQEGAAKVANKVTGAEFRQEFDEFTGAMATVTHGLWSDQQALSKRLSQLEKRLRTAWLLVALLAAACVVLLLLAVMAN